MNGTKFIRGKGGLGRKLPGEDFISGLIVYGEPNFNKSQILSKDDLDNINVKINPVLHYHASEFFRINAGATLYVQAVSESDGAFTEVEVLQNFTKGKIRQLAVCDYKTPMSALIQNVTRLNEIARKFDKQKTPLSILYSCQIEPSDMLALPNLHDANSERVSVVIGQDGAGRGAYIGNSVSCIGAALGAVSRAKVHENIGWVEKQNLVSTAYPKKLTGGELKSLEMEVAGFADGSLLQNYTPAQIDSIHAKGYIFPMYHAGISGTYLNDSFTATSLTDDFAYIENNRTIDKAIREVNRVVTPKVSAPAYVDATTGELDATTIDGLTALCEEPLDDMKRNGEISGYAVAIDPHQNVNQTSKIQIKLKIVPVGVMRVIEVEIGLTCKGESKKS